MEELKDAIPLQVHRKTDYPPMTVQLAGVFEELVHLRESKNQQVRKKARVRRHIDAVILDLWVAANYSDNPWRAVSRNKTDYRKETRYRRIYLKYDLLMGVLDDLIELGYIDQKLGFRDRVSGIGFQTRIKATVRLLEILNQFDIKQIVHDPDVPEGDTIIKKDASGKLLDYVDDIYTNEMREFLRIYNNTLRQTDIGTDAIDLRYRHDPTNITVKRVFNDEGGGRFYGGFWQNMPKLDRLKLLLENGPVVELDYAAFHPTIAYAFKGLSVTDDPYTIVGCERGDVKKAFLVLFNCRDRQHAINTIRGEFHITNAEDLLQKIEAKHSGIKEYFYNPGFGMTLQNTDAWIAEVILKRLTDVGIVCLPIHDSFIVLKVYEAELRAVMEDSFYERFNIKPIVK